MIVTPSFVNVPKIG